MDLRPSQSVASLTLPPAVLVAPPGMALAFSGGENVDVGIADSGRADEEELPNVS